MAAARGVVRACGMVLLPGLEGARAFSAFDGAARKRQKDTERTNHRDTETMEATEMKTSSVRLPGTLLLFVFSSVSLWFFPFPSFSLFRAFVRNAGQLST